MGDVDILILRLDNIEIELHRLKAKELPEFEMDDKEIEEARKKAKEVLETGLTLEDIEKELKDGNLRRGKELIKNR